MITIKEMSEILGLSTTTVSNVIHGKTKEVSEKTVKRVQELIDKYEYVPNINARNLANNSSKIIGVAIKAMKGKYENPINDPFMSEFLGAVEREIRRNGYFMMIYIADDISEILKCLVTWNVDGMVFFGVNEEESEIIKEKYKKPTVYIDNYFYKENNEFVNVGIEDFQGAYEMTKYLIENGHEKIGFFTDNSKGVDFERFNGYRKALHESNIEFNSENFIIIKPIQGKIDYLLHDIYELSNKFTALFCMSDYYAVKIMNYFMENGKKIPEDFSVVGFDNSIYAQISYPTLTTVDQNISQKGEVAIELLTKMINGEKLELQKVSLPTEVVIRKSVKRLTK